MASIITASASSGLTQSADTSGVLQLASGVGNLVTIPSVTGTAMVSGNMPSFSVTNNGSQSISSATETIVQYGAEIISGGDAPASVMRESRVNRTKIQQLKEKIQLVQKQIQEAQQQNLLMGILHLLFVQIYH